MSTLQCRGSIVPAALAVVLCCNLAGAQVLVSPGPRSARQYDGPINGYVTGVQYDVVNQAKAEKRLQYLQAKLERDAGRGHKAAADRDVREIANVKYRMAVNCWLIRENSQKDPGYYPIRIDEVSVAAINQAASPPQFAIPRQLPPESTPTPPPEPAAPPAPTPTPATTPTPGITPTP